MQKSAQAKLLFQWALEYFDQDEEIPWNLI